MKRITLCTILGVLLLVTGAALAQSDAYDVSWWTVDGGGGTFSHGGGYALGGTAGQPDAGLLTGGGYALRGGFWSGRAGAVEHSLYLPLVRRNQP
jgi:hypothetical protein